MLPRRGMAKSKTHPATALLQLHFDSAYDPRQQIVQKGRDQPTNEAHDSIEYGEQHHGAYSKDGAKPWRCVVAGSRSERQAQGGNQGEDSANQYPHQPVQRASNLTARHHTNAFQYHTPPFSLRINAQSPLRRCRWRFTRDATHYSNHNQGG